MRVVFSQHAIERYAERVRPTLTYDQACDELERLGAHVEVSDQAPPWSTEDWAGAEAWAWLGDTIVFPLQRENGTGAHVATTCLVSGVVSDFTRERRNARKAARRALLARKRQESERRRKAA